MGLGLAVSVTLLNTGQGIAQSDELTRAEFYRIQNEVELDPDQQPPRPAALADPFLPRDTVRTGSRSRTELLFNEGSLARIGAESIFRFVPGMRAYQLPDGSTRAEAILQLEQGIALVMGPPGSITNQVQTPEADITIAGAELADTAPVPPSTTAVVIVHSPTLGKTQVFNLTPNPVIVATPDGIETSVIEAGETLSITNGELGPVETFDLNRFYQTSGLAVGLGPDQAEQVNDESAQVQDVLNQIRAETVAAANDQLAQLDGFCNPDQAATHDCVTTDDNPLTTFEDEREMITDTGSDDSGSGVPGGGSGTPPGSAPTP
ncbi:MAG: FecR domain-containing protein [Cyanobacteria bacterium J06659_2]